jgi:hypothetical protein
VFDEVGVPHPGLTLMRAAQVVSEALAVGEQDAHRGRVGVAPTAAKVSILVWTGSCL